MDTWLTRFVGSVQALVPLVQNTTAHACGLPAGDKYPASALE